MHICMKVFLQGLPRNCHAFSMCPCAGSAFFPALDIEPQHSALLLPCVLRRGERPWLYGTPGGGMWAGPYNSGIVCGQELWLRKALFQCSWHIELGRNWVLGTAGTPEVTVMFSYTQTNARKQTYRHMSIIKSLEVLSVWFIWFKLNCHLSWINTLLTSSPETRHEMDSYGKLMPFICYFLWAL